MAEKKTRTYTNADTKRTPMTVTVEKPINRAYQDMLDEPSIDEILAGAKASLRRSEPLAQSIRNAGNKQGRIAGDAAGAREQKRLSNPVRQFVRGVRESPVAQGALVAGSVLPTPIQPAMASLLALEGAADFAEDPSLTNAGVAALGVLPAARFVRKFRAARTSAPTAPTGVFDRYMPNTSRSRYQTPPSQGGYTPGKPRATSTERVPYNRPDEGVEYVRGDRWMPNRPASSTATADDAAALPLRSPVDRWMPNTPANPTLADAPSRLSLRRLLDEDELGVAADIEAAAGRGPVMPVTNVRVGADELAGPSRFDLSSNQRQGVEALEALLEQTGGRTASRVAAGTSRDVAPVARIPSGIGGDEYSAIRNTGGAFAPGRGRAQRLAGRRTPLIESFWDEIAQLSPAERDFYSR